jgi:hypothetical protein
MVKHLQTWIQHCKSWANSHNCTYPEAIKSSECRNAYKTKGSESSPSVEVKPKRKYVRKSKLEVESVELPKEVLQVIQKRKYTRKAPVAV